MDYFRILNLSSEPFSNSPDPDFFFQSAQHVSCLQKLEISLRLKRGLNIVIGDVGAGKTTLSRLLIRRFSEDETTDMHLLLDPHFKTSLEFLKTVVEILGGVTRPDVTDPIKLKETIKNTLYRKGVDENRTVVLIIDEGQKLPLFCLEILREFLNYETNTFKLLQIVIFAQREFEETIGKLENFRDRINFYHELGSLNFKETRGLVEYRLKQASDSERKQSFFTWSGFIAIFLATGGFPRKIINLCHRSLLAMIIQNKSSANFLLVTTCMDKEGTKRFFSKLFLPAISLGVILLGAGLTGVMTSTLFHAPHERGVVDVALPEPAPIQEPKSIKDPVAVPGPVEKGAGSDIKEVTSPEETHLSAAAPPPLEKPASIVKGIVEQDITDEGKQEAVSANDQNDRSAAAKSDSVTLEPSGVRVLSGPGAGIEVRRLIPGSR